MGNEESKLCAICEPSKGRVATHLVRWLTDTGELVESKRCPFCTLKTVSYLERHGRQYETKRLES